MNSFTQQIINKMKVSSDFPSLSSTINSITEELHHADCDSDKITKIVLSDTALTKKVLRLANSPMYSQYGTQIDSVAYAIKILGIDAVSQLALSLVVLDSFTVNSDSDKVNQEMAALLMANEIAYVLDVVESPELRTLAVSLGNIGRLSVCFLFPEKWEIIKGKINDGISVNDAATEVIGISLEDLGGELSSYWRFPSKLIKLAKNDYSPEVSKITEFCTNLAYKFVNSNEQVNYDVINEEAERIGLPMSVSVKQDIETKCKEITDESSINSISSHKKDAFDLPSIFNSLVGTKEGLHTSIPKMLEGVKYLKPKMVMVLTRHPKMVNFKAEFGIGDEYSKYHGRVFDLSSINLFKVALLKNVDIYIGDLKKTTNLTKEFVSMFPKARSICVLPVIAEPRFTSIIYMEWLLPDQITSNDVIELKSFRNKILDAVIKVTPEVKK